jgi:ERF superfamily
MSSEIQTTEAISVQSEIGQILRLAVESKVPVDTIERLVALKERMDARSAASEFNNALASFQAECPSIKKTSTAKITTRSGGDYGYKYAELDQIARVIRPIIQRHGMSYSWDSEMLGDKIVCTCTVRHLAGHSQSAKFVCPTDSSSAMSGQQKHAAALTYARRQSLIQVLGLTTTDDDTDAATQQKITDEQAFNLEDMIADSGADRTKFLAYMGVARIGDILASDFKKAHTALLAKARKKDGGS